MFYKIPTFNQSNKLEQPTSIVILEPFMLTRVKTMIWYTGLHYPELPLIGCSRISVWRPPCHVTRRLVAAGGRKVWRLGQQSTETERLGQRAGWTGTASLSRSTTWGSRPRWSGGRSPSLSRRKLKSVLSARVSAVWAYGVTAHILLIFLDTPSQEILYGIISIIFQYESFHRGERERWLLDSLSR